MTKTVLFTLASLVVTAAFSPGQDVSPSPAVTATPARSVRISFVPPPLEGKISLGVYDESGHLVRVLHQEADLDEFNVGADALSTKWDGKDDYDNDLAAGKYSARGFLVAPMKIGPEIATTGTTEQSISSIQIKLVANPLENNERPTLNLKAGLDEDDVYIQSVDGLPLITVAKRQGAQIAWLLQGRENKSVTACVSDGINVRQYEVTGITKMMAFDCGKFELK
jgi:hypothetical protein